MDPAIHPIHVDPPFVFPLIPQTFCKYPVKSFGCRIGCKKSRSLITCQRRHQNNSSSFFFHHPPSEMMQHFYRCEYIDIGNLQVFRNRLVQERTDIRACCIVYQKMNRPVTDHLFYTPGRIRIIQVACNHPYVDPQITRSVFL